MISFGRDPNWYTATPVSTADGQRPLVFLLHRVRTISQPASGVQDAPQGSAAVAGQLGSLTRENSFLLAT